MIEIILASQSPRRKEILETLGYPFKVVPSYAEEYFDPSLPLTKALEQVATQKASEVYEKYPDALVIGADTIVEYNGKRYGKPKDLQEARQFLEDFSGSIQHVMTGICMIYKGKRYTHVDTTNVVFRDLSPKDITYYLEHFDVLDKAGAYGIQDSDFVTKIEGSYTNVVGLGIESVKTMLKKIIGHDQ